ncbi:hypothetical protein BJV74DRAFT_537839 [Russula compacta]|nr:hypothetical protein BJV74DRAFT_537839 [Russula compacta]
MVSCPGHLFDLQGSGHLRESPVTTRRKTRFRISTTFPWLDPTSTSSKACLPPTPGSCSFWGLAALVYRNSLSVEEQDLCKLLYAFIYRLYEPAHFADSSYIRTEFDGKTLPKYTMHVTFQQDGRAHTVDCPNVYSIYAAEFMNHRVGNTLRTVQLMPQP